MKTTLLLLGVVFARLLWAQSANFCDLNNDGTLDARDVEIAVHQADGTIPCTNGDINRDKACTAVDVQRVSNAVAGEGCLVGPGTPTLISSVTPTRRPAGEAGFTLTVKGKGFAQGGLQGAAVLWNGSPIATTFVGATAIEAQLTAVVPPTLIATPGDAKITVRNEGVTSNAETFTVIAATSVSVTPSELGFGNQILKISSAPRFIHLRNTGSANLVVSAVNVRRSGVIDFSDVAEGCAGSKPIAPGESCTIAVSFLPAELGTINAYVEIDDNATGSPHIISLSGQGVPNNSAGITKVMLSGLRSFSSADCQNIIGSPCVFVGTAVYQQFTLANTGPVALSDFVIAIASSTGDFTQTNSCGRILQPEVSCRITVAFNPSGPAPPVRSGIRTGVLKVMGNIPTGVSSANLVGAGAFPIADEDDDGIPDLWENNQRYVLYGKTVSLSGANSSRKDLFLHLDYLELAPEVCSTKACVRGHTHQPTADALEIVKNAFANAPVCGLKGVSFERCPAANRGISLHIDEGDPVASSSRSCAQRPHCIVETPANVALTDAGFYQIRAASFPPQEMPVFHYGLFAHEQMDGAESGNSFPAGMPGGDLVVSLGLWVKNPADLQAAGNGTDLQDAGTLMHELGHNLGLLHGGQDLRNYKPNYFSVMNYLFQTRGLIENGASCEALSNVCDGYFDFSRFLPIDSDQTLPALNQNALTETVGLSEAARGFGTRYYCAAVDKKLAIWSPTGACPKGTQEPDLDCVVSDATGPIDWNCNGQIDKCTGATASTGCVRAGIDSQLYPNSQNGVRLSLPTLKDFEDWSQLQYTGPLNAFTNPNYPCTQGLPCALKAAILSYGDVGNPDQAPSTEQPPDAKSELSTVSEVPNATATSGPSEELTLEQDSRLTTVVGLSVASSGDVIANPGTTTSITFALTNKGISDDSFIVKATSDQTWADLGNVSPIITLAPKETTVVVVPVSVAAQVAAGAVDHVVLKATSQSNRRVFDNALSRVVTPSADLSVSVFAGPSPISVHDKLTYVVTIGNAGPTEATGIKLQNLLPANVTFISSTPSQGTCERTPDINCDIGTLSTGATAIVIISVSPNTPRILTNVARVSSVVPDPNLTNNTATVRTTPTDLRGDLNGDGDVDLDDVNIEDAAVLAGSPVSGPNDPRDLNGDGRINILDLQILINLCTRAGCATH